MITAPFSELEFFGHSAFPTADGRKLCFSEALVEGKIQIALEHRDSDEFQPIDVLRASLSLADERGMVWTVEAKATTEFLLAQALDLSFVESGLSPEAAASPELRAALQVGGVRDVRFSCDDRFYRRLLIGEKVQKVKFHDSTMHFDLAFAVDDEEEEDGEGLPRLVVRLRENSLTDADSGEAIGPIVFEIDWMGFFRANAAVYSEDYESWRQNPLPAPLLFSATARRAEPNEGVSVS